MFNWELIRCEDQYGEYFLIPCGGVTYYAAWAPHDTEQPLDCIIWSTHGV